MVDEQGRLLGRITIDDVVDVIRGESDHSLMSMAGMDEHDDMFAPVLTTSKRRAIWLGINLATALLASWVIGLFESTLDELVALAVLMPVVASMGGIAGSQVLTVVVRGMALGQVERSNAARLVAKELAVGAINSVCWAVVVGLVAFAWSDNIGLGIIVGTALVLNVIGGGVFGGGDSDGVEETQHRPSPGWRRHSHDRDRRDGLCCFPRFGHGVSGFLIGH